MKRKAEPQSCGESLERASKALNSGAVCNIHPPDVDQPRLPEGCWRGQNIGIYARRGLRPGMEDAWAVSELGAGLRAFSVYDGHGGSFVSSYAAANLHNRLAGHLASRQHADISACLKAAYLAVDAELRESMATQASGSTAVTCILDPSYIYSACAGDSRAVLGRAGTAVALTADCKPARADEHARITRAGGKIVWCNGLRVMGALAMTRALGDHALQPYGVSPEPEVTCTPRSAEDDFLLIASDGLWDVVSSEAAVTLASRALRAAVDNGLPRAVATEVVVPRLLAHVAAERGSKDNVAVLFIDLKSCSRGVTASAAARQADYVAPAEARPQPARVGVPAPAVPPGDAPLAAAAEHAAPVAQRRTSLSAALAAAAMAAVIRRAVGRLPAAAASPMDASRTPARPLPPLPAAAATPSAAATALLQCLSALRHAAAARSAPAAQLPQVGGTDAAPLAPPHTPEPRVVTSVSPAPATAAGSAVAAAASHGQAAAEPPGQRAARQFLKPLGCVTAAEPRCAGGKRVLTKQVSHRTAEAAEVLCNMRSGGVEAGVAVSAGLAC